MTHLGSGSALIVGGGARYGTTVQVFRGVKLYVRSWITSELGRCGVSEKAGPRDLLRAA
ncbi:MAG: hypothetical protein ACP5O0_01880 [Acidimicrobiales bacterium]